MNSDDAKKLPNVGPYTRALPGQWPEQGVVVKNTNDLAILSSYDFSDITKAHFTGFTWNGNHYCPTAPWGDWVKLAKHILEIETARIAQDLDEYARVSKAFVA